MKQATREQALATVRAFHAEHGRLPRWREWERATESRPSAKTRWGWRELLAEAIGVAPHQIDLGWGVEQVWISQPPVFRHTMVSYRRATHARDSANELQRQP